MVTQPERIDSRVGRNKTTINPWNHIDSLRSSGPNNAYVEMGPLYMAVHDGNRWQEWNVGVPCKGYTYGFAEMVKPLDTDVVTCGENAAFAGIGHKGWNRADRHLHGWVKNGKRNFPSNNIQYAIVWGTARMVPIDPNRSADLDGEHYLYAVGMDPKTPGDTNQIYEVTHGHHRLIKPSWRVYVGHTMSPATLRRLCREENLPPSLPFVGSCD